MKYPEEKASYHYEPKFLDEVKRTETPDDMKGEYKAGVATGEGRLEKLKHLDIQKPQKV